MQNKLDWSQFLSNQADIQATLPTHELITLTKFHLDWQKIVNFLVIVKLWPSLFFFLQQCLECIFAHAD